MGAKMTVIPVVGGIIVCNYSLPLSSWIKYVSPVPFTLGSDIWLALANGMFAMYHIQTEVFEELKDSKTLLAPVPSAIRKT